MAGPTARDIMARSEATFSPEADIYDAVQQLLKYKLTGAAVVDTQGVLRRHADRARVSKGACRWRAGWSAERSGQGLHGLSRRIR